MPKPTKAIMALATGLSFLSTREVKVVMCAGEALLGVPRKELGGDFVAAFDRVAADLEDFLRSDLHKLLLLLNVVTLGRFTRMEASRRERLLAGWGHSRIPLLRTSFVTLRALCGWSWYSLRKSWPELEFPGETIGRENELPTLLFGKSPWTPPPSKPDAMLPLCTPEEKIE